MDDIIFPEHSQTAIAKKLYNISPYPVPLALVRATLLVKRAACLCNTRLAHLDQTQSAAIIAALDFFDGLNDQDLQAWFGLDAFMGGAGTAINMNVNEAIALHSAQREGPVLDVYQHVNLHQSTNDVMPSALHLMLLDQLQNLESQVAGLQAAAQEREQAFAGTIVPGHTQLQDAICLDAGRIPATWAGVLLRDRWRIFKARERLKELNLGGTAIGSGAGAPRRYVLEVIRDLQKLTKHPVSRAEDPLEATSNYDSVAEAMSVVNVLAGSIKRIATDIRLLSSGPVSGMGLLHLPRLLKGSTIMPGKINPVVAEAAIQVAEKVMANDALIARLCASSELQLNAFFPLIAFSCHESLQLLCGLCPLLSDYISMLEINKERAAKTVEFGQSASLALTPLFGYRGVEVLIARAKTNQCSLKEQVQAEAIFDEQEIELLFSKRSLEGAGYDEALYDSLRNKHAAAIAAIAK